MAATADSDGRLEMAEDAESFAVPAGNGGEVSLPEGINLADASFTQSGGDLVLTMPDGTEVTVEGFFDQPNPPQLVDEGGAVISGPMAASFAVPDEQVTAGTDDSETLFPMAEGGIVGQAVSGTDGAPIGQVEEISGEVWAVRVDGTRVQLELGDEVYQGDILESGPEGAIGIILADQTTFSMGEEGRMVLDEMVYDPGTQEGEVAFSVLQGVFTFVSGQVAKTDPDAMTIDTPVATIGIRGTQVGIDISGDDVNITLMEELDGFVGEVVVFNEVGSLVMNNANESTIVRAWDQEPEQSVIGNDDDTRTNYEPALKALPKNEQGNANDMGVKSGSYNDDGSDLADFNTAAGGEAEAEQSATDARLGFDIKDDIFDVLNSVENQRRVQEDVIIETIKEKVAEVAESSAVEDDVGPEPETPQEKAQAIIQGLDVVEDVFIDTESNELKIKLKETVDEDGNVQGVEIDFEQLLTDAGIDTSFDIEVTGTGGDDVVTVAAGSDTVDVADGDDTVRGSAANDQIFGGAGDDTLEGGDGDDVLEGGAGADQLIGGAGFDTAAYTQSEEGVTVDLSTGMGGDAEGDTLVEIEGVIGSSQGDVLIGDDGYNVLDGGDGDDVLDGGRGPDLLIGGDGEDTVTYADFDPSAQPIDLGDVPGGETIIESLGTDLLGAVTPGVIDGVAVQLGEDDGDGNVVGQFNSDGDVLIGIENLTGTAYGDYLGGDSGDNTLKGGDGDDILFGGDGDDYVDGGLGDDFIIGGSGRGNDIYIGGEGTDTVSYASAPDDYDLIINLAEGYATDADPENPWIDYDILEGIENVLSGAGDDVITGSDGDNVIHGGAGADIIDGGAGDDLLIGGAGDDILIGGEGVNILVGGAGQDTAKFDGAFGDFRVRLDDAGQFLIRNLADGSETTLDGVEFMSFINADGTENVIEAVGLPPAISVSATPAGDEDNAIALNIAPELLDEVSNFETLTITGVPVGATLSAGTDNGDGVWTVSGDELRDLIGPNPIGDGTNLLDLSITPPENFSDDFSLTFQMQTTVGLQSDPFSTIVNVDPVADAPTFADDAGIAVLENGLIRLDLDAVTTDPSESISSYTLSGLSSDMPVIIGDPNGPHLIRYPDANGDLTLSTAAMEGLGVYVGLPDLSEGSVSIGVTATSVEREGGVVVDSADSEAFVINIVRGLEDLANEIDLPVSASSVSPVTTRPNWCSKASRSAPSCRSAPTTATARGHSTPKAWPRHWPMVCRSRRRTTIPATSRSPSP